MSSDHEIVPVVVFEGNYWEATLVKSLLENAEVKPILNDEFRKPMTRIATGIGDTIKVMVSGEDLEKARIVVDEFEKVRRETQSSMEF